jgi:fatty acid desaturase
MAVVEKTMHRIDNEDKAAKVRFRFLISGFWFPVVLFLVSSVWFLVSSIWFLVYFF